MDNLKKVADLHTHSTASDGLVEPVQLVEMARNNGLSAIALTDHDTILGIKSLIDDKLNYGIELITGVEVSVNFDPIMHIIALFVDLDNEKMNNMLNKICRARKYLMVQSFGILRLKGIKLCAQEVMKKNKILSVDALSDFLVEEKYFASRMEVDDLFSEIWEEWRRILPTSKECIEIIHQAGGIAILAHPILLELNNEELKEQLKELKNLGLDGLEINHPNQPDEYRKMLKKYAQEMDFLISGGSDYHGKNNREFLSKKDFDTAISYENIEDMRKRTAGSRK